MIQIQTWNGSKRILVVNNIHHGSVQVYIPDADAEDNSLKGKADALVYALWVDEPVRGHGVAGRLLESAEREARAQGCRSLAIEWDARESPEWVLRWYERVGYKEIGFGRHKSLLVKHL